MARFLSKYKGLVLVMHLKNGERKRLYFVDGEYETNDRDEINFIRKHPRFNRTISEIEEILIPKRSSKKEE